MKIKKEFHTASAIKITPEKLEKVVSLFNEYYKELSFHARLIDDSTVEFTDFNELVAYDNFDKRRIKQVWIFGQLGYDSTALYCRFDVFPSYFISYSHSIEVEYTLDSIEATTVFRAKLAECVAEMKRPPIYTILCKLSATFLVILIWMICCSIVVIYTMFGGTITSTSEHSTLWYICWVLIGIPICAVLRQVDKLWCALFPPLVFFWGEEIERERKRATLRGNIFWGVIIATVVGVVIAFITK